MRTLGALLVAALLAVTPARAQSMGVHVSPILIDIPAERGVASFRLRNGRDREMSFEVEVFAWSQENGESVLTPTDNLIIAPSTFIVSPEREQIVRLGVAPAARGGAVESAYRIVLRELPGDGIVRNGFRVQLEMSMPVFVRPQGAAPNLMIARTRDEDGAPAIAITNTGASRVSLSNDPNSARVENLPRYLLAGATAIRRVDPSVRSIGLLYAGAESTVAEQRTFELSDAPVLAANR